MINKVKPAVRSMIDNCHLEDDHVQFDDFQIERWLDKGFSGKANLCSMVGLDETNNWRKIIKVAASSSSEEELRDQHFELAEFLTKIWGANNYSLVDRKGPNGQKLTRSLLKHFASNGIDEEKMARDFPWLERQYGIKKVADIGPRLGEALSTSGYVVVSANPLDFIGAGYNCAYGSCYRPGPYDHQTIKFNATNALWYSSPNTLVVYTTLTKPVAWEIPYKVGRVWIYIELGDESGHPYMLWGREFGTIGASAAKLAREAVLRPLRILHGETERRWKNDRASVEYRGDHPGYYGDCPHWWIFYLPTDRLKPNRHEPAWEAGMALCWQCGRLTTYHTGYVCAECARANCNRCYMCHSIVAESSLHEWDGERYCTQCMDEITFICHHCGARTGIRDGMHDPDNRLLCYDCFTDRVVECDWCDGLAWAEEVEDIDEIDYKNLMLPHTICPSCATTLVVEACHNCGEQLVTNCPLPTHPLIYDDLGRVFCCQKCMEATIFAEAVDAIGDVTQVLAENGD